MHSDTSKFTRVAEEPRTALAALKDEDETFDRLLSRLLEKHRESVRAGAGLREGSC